MVAAGLASYLQFSYGPVHSVIPFLLLGEVVSSSCMNGLSFCQ